MVKELTGCDTSCAIRLLNQDTTLIMTLPDFIATYDKPGAVVAAGATRVGEQ